MPLQIVRNDITKIECDAIVNAANSTLLGGGGVDGAIHRAAGKGLLLECMKLGGCKTGEAKITGGYKLPCKYVIHTVGPKWKGGERGEKELLESCYRNSLKLALENGCESVAFPLISSGVYGYPKAQALRVAVNTVTEFLSENDLTVYIVVFDKTAYTMSEKLFADISSYIDEAYVQSQPETRFTRVDRNGESAVLYSEECLAPEAFSVALPKEASTLDDALNQIDESFSQMLLRKIDEKGMSDSECYKKANIDRRLFSKIRTNADYKPAKTTAVAFAVALELPIEEARDMLMKAGFALSHSSKFDIIIEYFIKNGNYNVYEINEALFAFDQPLLGV